MANWVKKAGKDLQHGVPQTDGMIAQSGSKTAGGELKVYKDESGNDISLYVNDEHTEVQIEGLLETGAADKKIGDEITLGGITGRITAWTIQWSNEEVTKVSGSIRTYDIA